MADVLRANRTTPRVPTWGLYAATAVLAVTVNLLAIVPLVFAWVRGYHRFGWTWRLAALVLVTLLAVGVLNRLSLWTITGSSGHGPSPVPTPHP